MLARKHGDYETIPGRDWGTMVGQQVGTETEQFS